jgi:predicted ATP-grasp superfamily ATP-dependent carboligase
MADPVYTNTKSTKEARSLHELRNKPSAAKPSLLKGRANSGKFQKVDALVTQGWGRIAYNVVRSLGKKGLTVGVGLDEFIGMAAASKYTRLTFRHPSFITQTEGFIQSVRQAVFQHQPKALIPADQDILTVARYKEEFEDLDVKTAIAPFDTLKQLHKKDEVVRLANELGIPVPNTLIPKNMQDIAKFAEQHGYPVVMKRTNSSGSRGVSYHESDSKFLKADNVCTNGTALQDVILQEYVQGTGYGVSMLFSHGRMRAKFTHRRLREKLHTGGISTLRMSTENPLLEEYAECLLSKVNFHGVAMVEFKYDEKKKQGWLIEVNPRFWGSVGLAIQSGVDFPYLLYKLALNGDVTPVTDYRKNVAVRWILGDVLGYLRQKLHARGASLPREYSGVQGYDDYYADDPLPFFAQIAFAALKKIRTRNFENKDIEVPLT